MKNVFGEIIVNERIPKDEVWFIGMNLVIMKIVVGEDEKAKLPGVCGVFSADRRRAIGERFSND